MSETLDYILALFGSPRFEWDHWVDTFVIPFLPAEVTP